MTLESALAAVRADFRTDLAAGAGALARSTVSDGSLTRPPASNPRGPLFDAQHSLIESSAQGRRAHLLAFIPYAIADGIPARQRATEASLRQRVETLRAENQRVRDENSSLKAELALAYGRQRHANGA